MPSLQTGLTTAPRSMLASLPVDWGVWIKRALSLVHSLHLQLPPFYMPSLQTGLTTAPRSMLASLPGICRSRLEDIQAPGCLDRVLRSAARLIGGIPKFGHVSKYMLDVLHWLPAEQR